jgi:tetratricopeptide (TPR) repeat protein
MKRVFLLLVIVLFHSRIALADGVPAATVFSLQGSATVERAGASLPATEKMVVTAGDEIVVGDPGRVALQLPDGSYIRLAGGSRMRFPGAATEEVGLVAGALHFFSHSEKHPTVVTEHVTAAIRGTEFTLSTSRESTTISMLSGTVQGSSSSGTASLAAGQGARFMRGKAPEVYALIQSDRSVQWSAFIPVLGATDIDTPATRRALTLASEGETQKALARVPAGSRQCGVPEFTHARILIAAGSVAKGASMLERCLEHASSSEVSAHVAATLSLVRLMQGDAATAGTLSERAMATHGDAPEIRFARSLALQDRGDLEGALAVVEGETTDSTLLARRAEILFMFGRVPEARALLESLTGRSWYSDAVLGFVLMGDRDFEGAEAAFNRAVVAEPAAGLPHMGLGIVEFNKGNLEAGRTQFERATVLEPSRSTYRSYLAKSYFESDTYDPAEPEYNRAMELDKNDPTPYLYRSFMRIAQNRPVEALHDLEEARDLSDKRDVYRSQFLLDEDSAVQSASLARVYRDLGFEQRGRIEAISAIYSDYENASAHRLLGETEENIVTASSSLSERRISDLFAPLSINVADSIGTSVSLNEYSALFERAGWRTGISTGYSSRDDQFLTGVMSANKTGNLVTALTATGVAGDGFVDDPRSNEGRVGISLQGQPTWADRFLVEARGTFIDNNQTDESNQVDSGFASGSYLHRFSPDTTFVAQTAFRRTRDKVVNPSYPYDVLFEDSEGSLIDTIETETYRNGSEYETAVENEVQLIDKRGPVTSIVTGRFAHYNVDLSERALVFDDTFGGALDGSYLRSQGSAGLNTGSVSYLGTVAATEDLLLNVGGEYSSVQFVAYDEAPYADADDNNSKITPKGGIVYKPKSSVMLRTGYGEYLGRSTREGLVSIEPTLVGGITQRYTDVLPGTQAKNWGSGIDLQPFDSTYIGSEWNRRWLEQPRSESFYTLVLDPSGATATLGDEYLSRFNVPIQQDFVTSYLYHIINKRIVLGSDYKFNRSSADSPDDSSLTDQIGRGFSRYFFTNMFFGQLATNYRYQDRLNTFAGTGTSSGWTFDALVGYRLPTRHGAVTAGVRNIFGQDLDLLQDPYFNEVIFNDPLVELAARFNF